MAAARQFHDEPDSGMWRLLRYTQIKTAYHRYGAA